MTHASVDVERAVRRVVGLFVRGPTFGELALEWLEKVSPTLLQPSNERRHLQLLEPLFEHRESELTPPDITALLAGLLRPKGTLGPAGRNRVRSTGLAVITAAREARKWVGPNPFESVRRLKEPTRPRFIPTLEQLQLVLPFLPRPRWREAVSMVGLGPRPGELKAVRKEDLNHELRVLAVCRSNRRNTTKTGEPRYIAVPDALWSVLLEAADESPSELLFPGRRGGLQSRFSKHSKMLREAFARAGVRGAGRMRFYDLRHTAATLHAEAGCNHAIIRATLGHARDLTEKTYTHFSPEFQRRELGKMVDGLLGFDRL